LGILVQRSDHRLFRQQGDRAIRYRGRRCHPYRLAGEAPLSEEASWSEDPDDRLLPLSREDRQLDLSSLDEEHGIRAITLREDRLVLPAVPGRSSRADRCEQR